jgi:hypothetical protein
MIDEEATTRVVQTSSNSTYADAGRIIMYVCVFQSRDCSIVIERNLLFVFLEEI